LEDYQFVPPITEFSVPPSPSTAHDVGRRDAESDLRDVPRKVAGTMQNDDTAMSSTASKTRKNNYEDVPDNCSTNFSNKDHTLDVLDSTFSDEEAKTTTTKRLDQAAYEKRESVWNMHVATGAFELPPSEQTKKRPRRLFELQRANNDVKKKRMEYALLDSLDRRASPHSSGVIPV
jgi:hypothetical protein